MSGWTETQHQIGVTHKSMTDSVLVSKKISCILLLYTLIGHVESLFTAFTRHFIAL